MFLVLHDLSPPRGCYPSVVRALGNQGRGDGFLRETTGRLLVKLDAESVNSGNGSRGRPDFPHVIEITANFWRSRDSAQGEMAHRLRQIESGGASRAARILTIFAGSAQAGCPVEQNSLYKFFRP